MSYLSRRYVLQVSEQVSGQASGTGRLDLRQRTDGQRLWTATFTKIEGLLSLRTCFPYEDTEAIRLLIQWALTAETGVTCLTLPAPQDLQGLQAWASFGARLEGTSLSVRAADFAAANRALGCKGAAWLEREQAQVRVACIALINAADEVLLAQRPAGKTFAGLWEFPGGKIDAGESPELALCREVEEELGLSIWNSCLSPLTFVSHSYPDFHLTLLAYACYRFEGSVQAREGQTLKWCQPEAMQADRMPAANAPLIHAVQDLLG